MKHSIGGILVSPCPSVRQNRVRSVSSTILVGFISYLHISSSSFRRCVKCNVNVEINKANLRDLIAATGLVILLKLDSNRVFFALVTLKFDGWPRKIIRHVFYTTSNFVYHFISISKFKLELQSGNAQSGSNKTIFFSCVTLQFDVWPWKHRAPLLCYY